MKIIQDESSPNQLLFSNLFMSLKIFKQLILVSLTFRKCREKREKIENSQVHPCLLCFPSAQVHQLLPVVKYKQQSSHLSSSSWKKKKKILAPRLGKDQYLSVTFTMTEAVNISLEILIWLNHKDIIQVNSPSFLPLPVPFRGIKQNVGNREAQNPWVLQHCNYKNSRVTVYLYCTLNCRITEDVMSKLLQ